MLVAPGYTQRMTYLQQAAAMLCADVTPPSLVLLQCRRRIDRFHARHVRAGETRGYGTVEGARQTEEFLQGTSTSHDWYE